MVGRHISSLGESGVHSLFGLWLPLMAASRGVIFYANVVKSAESKTWGLLEADSLPPWFQLVPYSFCFPFPIAGFLCVQTI